MHLALYKGKGQIGNALIRWWTGNSYSHCELVIDGICYSSSVMDKGVRSKSIDLTSGNWDLVELPSELKNPALDYFKKTEHDSYGWPSLIASQIFNRNHTSKHAAFCSEWCAAALNLPCPPTYSPSTLSALCSWLVDVGHFQKT